MIRQGDARPQFSQGDNDGPGPAKQGLFVQAGLAHDQIHLIIIGDQNPAPVYGLGQVFRIQHGEGLPGVEDIVDLPGLAEARVVDHVFKIARRDNHQGLRRECVEIQNR